jgi:ABC-2 type transport system ATP-binding protein
VSTAIETTGLGKRYGRAWALHDCTVSLPAGKIAALVGPNGAGKTTLLHLLVGLIRPDAGTVRVLDRTPGKDRDLLPRIGFVAQDTPLYTDFTAAELITMGSKLNREWDSALAEDRLTKLRIPLDRQVAKLSGGQRAQIALALAMAKRPTLLLLDEPVASLDPLARRGFLQALMGGVADEGITVLLSSHLLGDLERVCDYLVVLQEGQVQVLGEVDALVDAHKVLIGPRREPDGAANAIAGVAAVISESHTDRQSTLLVRTSEPIRDPRWDVRDVSLEDLVLAYLADVSAGTLPGPALAEEVIES